ncbi:enoyl-CoA hydratase-related protein [Mycolicibacterium fortuitum]|uniref:enoyl-CoA hydratase-related protein n=1 Tax=Mycolicibacterium fortuitum TaxID=1766 RepID=UPI00148F4DC1|nr:3-hydroxyacyl-CoA dehydrogenase [Mycolicibacterium fortuitum]
MFDWREDDDGVVILTMNDVDSPANTVNSRFKRDFPTVLDRLEAERESIRGVVLTSGKSTFFAGADLSEFASMGVEAIAGVTTMLDTLKANFRRLEKLGRPVVAAINGAALGGGCELALACHHRVVIDAPGVLVGLPESTLGVLPGAGGTVRCVQMFGLQKALDEVLLPGTRFTPRQALDVGLVDAVVSSAEELIAAAVGWIADNPEPRQPWDTAVETRSDGSMTTQLMMLPARLMRKTRGAPCAAARAILECTVEGALLNFESAQAIESRRCAALIADTVSSNIIEVTFFEPREIRRRSIGRREIRAQSAVVIGANQVAAEVAQACATAGINTTVADVEPGDAHLAAVTVSKLLGTGAGRVDSCALHLIPDADVVIESVFSDAAERRRQLGIVSSQVGPSTLIVSNSSALPIGQLVTAVSEPRNLLGMHFFTPVRKMELLEIIEAQNTSADALSRAIDLGRQLGKTSVVMGDAPGFYATRILHAYLDEAAAMLREGVPASSIERAAARAGYAVGPLALIDELSMAVLMRINEEIASPLSATAQGEPSSLGAVLNQMSGEFGRAGRAGDAGFYEYHAGRRTTLWSELHRVFGAVRAVPNIEELRDRLLIRQSREALLAREDGVVRDETEGNVASVLGVGFPSWTGGCLRFVDQYKGGRAGFIVRCNEFADEFGDRFRLESRPTAAT